MRWQIEQRNGLYLSELDWHLDARHPVKRSFVSHAHFDHTGKHQTILCSPPTAQLIQQRLSGERKWIIKEFGETFELEPGVEACLYPAGHIAGSAMLWLKKAGQSFLYTGDFKLTPGISAEPCQPVAADTLVMETTYGLPRYTFPPENEVYADIIRFCRDTLENGDTPVLFGYSLGKSQSILRSLTDQGLEVMLHPTALKLTQSCQKLGWKFPQFLSFDPRNQEGKVVISPPLAKTAEWMKSIRNPKTAMISGWAIDPSASYRYQCDRTFPLSDHADYLDLQNFVAKVQPKEVYTVHGFAKEFAATLREQGYQAWALGRENQLGLAIETQTPELHSTNSEDTDQIPADPSASQLAADSFQRLALTGETLSQSDSLQKKSDLLEAQLASLDAENVSHCLKLLHNPSPADLEELPPKLVKQSLILATGSSESKFKSLYHDFRDNRKVARVLFSQNPSNPSRTLSQICSFLKTLTSAPNPIFKQSLLSEQFRKLSPSEGCFFFDFLCGTSQSGLSADLLCQAIATRFDRQLPSVQSAFLRSGSLTTVSTAAATDTLPEIRIKPFHPIRPMAAKTEDSAEAIIEKQGLSVWAEFEHDGIRCQIHKDGDHIDLYDTEGQRITHLFPEFVDDARKIPQHFICDAVVVPWGYEKPLPRGDLEKRLNRKAEELFLGEEIPVVLWLFDLLSLSGDDLLDLPLEKRRQRLDTLSVTPKIRITPVHPLVGVEQIEHTLEKAATSGSKGLVFKDSESPYNPLSKSPSWLRLPARARD
ncbi:MBL fold metallo-hydrolase RNA specificity domain-containing protein [Pelagicoccus sp. SDUM812002]|uniref:ATP-dependent DNA ligase n=1 Tax=Pelagicoccus sp. SDUM812002 TaxID=3041266 RepID=UPI00280E8567|nr:MBL fold metallo-hydrolase RNA specificity domain-containing protein [Pelagicoccus sp. SDUM812002]MDQ8185077.1 MBL fold metallo-hydrolase RNA specificity domain-containing protein [Pelagicoccus sp. SDUM812002]